MAHDEGAGEPVETGVWVFDLTGRPAKGWLPVDPDGCAEDKGLRRWVNCGVADALSLPPR